MIYLLNVFILLTLNDSYVIEFTDLIFSQDVLCGVLNGSDDESPL